MAASSQLNYRLKVVDAAELSLTFGGFGRASHVRVRGFKRNACPSRLRDLVDPLVRTVDRAAVARANVTAVQDVLHS